MFLRLNADPEQGDDLRHTKLLGMPDIYDPVGRGSAPTRFSPKQATFLLLPKEIQRPALLLVSLAIHSCLDGVKKGGQEIFGVKEHPSLQWERTQIALHGKAISANS